MAELLVANKDYKAKNYEKAFNDVMYLMDRTIQKNMAEVLKLDSRYDPDFPPEKFAKSKAGATCTMLLITPDELICANAGDSRTVLSRGGKAVPMSFDHKPDDEKERKRAEHCGGHVTAGRIMGQIACSRGLGDLEFKNNKDFSKPE